jgi:aspartate-semialdehyde dehydrogenase
MRTVLAERRFPADDVRFFASSASAGTELEWDSGVVAVEDVATSDFAGVDIALMSVGATASLEIAPRFAAAGAWAIDNSSAWRMDPDVPLVVPEVNAAALAHAPKRIIANPNCTTMAAMPVLAPLHAAAGLVSLTVATYQSASGAGRDGVEELARQFEQSHGHNTRVLTFDGEPALAVRTSTFPGALAYNVLPVAGTAITDGSGETSEERKFRLESRKILSIPDLAVSITCVRVPVFTGHSLAITASFARALSPEEATAILRDAPGVALADVPTPLLATGKDPSYVGRIRIAETVTHGLSFFVVSDNLRKGAALNAVQIAEELLARA